MIRDKYIDSNKALLILFSKSFEEHFSGTDAKYALYDAYLKNIDFTNQNEKILDLIKSFPHKKLLHDKSLVELLEYDGFSLWWFVRQGFYGHCLDLIKNVHTIRYIIKIHRIRKVILINPNEKTVELFKQVSKKIIITIINKKRFYDQLKLGLWAGISNSLAKYTPRTIRFFQGLIRSYSHPKDNKKNNILVLTQSHTWTNLGNDIEGDPNTYSIVRALKKSKKYNVILLDMAIDAKSSWKGIKKEKKPFIPYDFFLVKTYFSLGTQTKLAVQKAKLKKLWNLLNKNSIMNELLVIQDISLYPYLKDKIKDYFLKNFDSFISAARNIEAGKEIIESFNVNQLILVDENGKSRFLVYASKMKNAFSLGIQHGIITSSWSIPYNYSKKDLHGYPNNLNCQLTDNTAVFGEYFKHLLINSGNYPRKNPIVTGQPRTDILYENTNKYSKKELYSKLGIDIKNRLVVFASQPLPDINDSKITLAAIIQSLRKFQDVQLVIKLHPNDTESNYEEILTQYNYSAKILKDFDIYWLIYCCEFLIGISSTVLLETLLLNKPAIQLNLSSDYKLLDDDSKMLMKVRNEKELNSCITDLFKNRKFISNLSKRTNEFISRYFYKVDGHSTDRILKIIESQK